MSQNPAEEVNPSENTEMPEQVDAAETTAEGDPAAELETLQAKVDENWALYLEARAETENVRKRSDKDVSNARLFALEKFVQELLPVKDSLEMGIKATKASDDAEATKELLEGTELTLKMLEKALEKFGVSRVEAIGEKLNPELHEAVTMLPSPEHESNTIIDVIQTGYTLNQRLVRPALVVVAQ